MNDKKQMLSLLNEEFERWEDLLSSLSEEQITDPRLPANLSIKDVVSHLWAWQQRSIARLEGGLNDREPEFPSWSDMQEPDTDDEIDHMNAWIYETTREKPWPSVYEDWRAGFLHFMDLVMAIPEKDLLDAGKYTWLDGSPLSSVVEGCYGHHQSEHFEPMVAWLRQNGVVKGAG